MMRLRIRARVTILLAWFVLAGATLALAGDETWTTTAERPSPSGADATKAGDPDAATRRRVAEAYGDLPLAFEANRGQADPRVQFLSRGGGHVLFLTPTEAVLVLTSPAPATKHARRLADRTGQHEAARRAALRMTFVGANPTPEVTGLEELPGKAHYFIGNDRAKWRPNIPAFAKVRYDDLWPGIDLVYYGNHRQLEYDLVVRPGADPGRILLGIQGADRLELDSQGDLVLHTSAGRVRHRRPVLYQETNGVRTEIAGAYSLEGPDRLGFQVAAYDRSRPLVIDPVLAYSTYLGGSLGAVGGTIAVDGAGNAYVGGATISADFPTTAGAFDTSYNGGIFEGDAFVTKFNPTGSALVYSTYLGGSNDDGGGIALDAAGNVYLTGETSSTDFPTTPGAFQTAYGGGFTDAFVAKLDPTGSALVYSTYLGGSGRERGIGIARDAAGNAYVTGDTDSVDFPTTAGAFQTAFGGVRDAFVTKLDPAGAALVYSTYLGGSDDDGAWHIAVDLAGTAHVTGGTGSSDFPTTAGRSRRPLAASPTSS
jgi:hypothetical protein